MPHTRSSIKAVLKDRQLTPKKRFGQNFLVHAHTTEALLDRAAPSPDDTIIEFGVGLGSLTIPLAHRVKQVIGIEIDAGIVKWHQEEAILPDNVRLIHQDLLKSDLSALAAETGQPLKIIANLPYSISNPVIFLLIHHRIHISSAVLMLQKEVAERLSASPRTKSYGVLSVLLATCATVTPLMRLGPEQFHPRPKVDSVVVRLDFTRPAANTAAFPGYDQATLHAIVKGAFQQRRKTMTNALYATGVGSLSKEDVAAALSKAGIEPNRRPDQVTVEEYLALTLAYQQHLP